MGNLPHADSIFPCRDNVPKHETWDVVKGSVCPLCGRGYMLGCFFDDRSRGRGYRLRGYAYTYRTELARAKEMTGG